jgi:hypothetical protein
MVSKQNFAKVSVRSDWNVNSIKGEIYGITQEIIGNWTIRRWVAVVRGMWWK